MFTVVRDARGKGVAAIAEVLKKRLSEQEEKPNGFDDFSQNQWSHKPIKRILARMIDYVEVGSGGESRSPGSRKTA